MLSSIATNNTVCGEDCGIYIYNIAFSRVISCVIMTSGIDSLYIDPFGSFLCFVIQRPIHHTPSALFIFHRVSGHHKVITPPHKLELFVWDSLCTRLTLDGCPRKAMQIPLHHDRHHRIPHLYLKKMEKADQRKVDSEM